MNVHSVSRAEQIAQLNDKARQAMGLACRAVATVGFRALPSAEQSVVRELIETYDAFTPDNDPYGERDFGAIHQASDGSWTTARPKEALQKVLWKIDYYDPSLQWGSEDPTNPAVTRRVLTIMLAEEY